MKFTLPKQVQQIFTIFENNSIELFLVGGSVRDLILNIDINDYDFTCICNSDEILQMFDSYKDITCFHLSEKYGTVVIIIDNLIMEITPYRIEGTYSNHRHPDKINRTNSIIDDLSRRDFTINAIAYNPIIGLIDPCDGLTDIKSKVINCVGNPEDRFIEDALRMLRAIRFSLKLGFKLNPKVMIAIQENAHLLNIISKERIKDEINKSLLLNKDNTLLLLNDSGILNIIFPVFTNMDKFDQNSKWHIHNLLLHTNIALNNAHSLPLVAKLAILFHDIAKPESRHIGPDGKTHYPDHAKISALLAKQILNQYHYPKQYVKKVAQLIYFHDTYIKLSIPFIQKFVSYFDHDVKSAILELQIQFADNLGKNPKMVSQKNKDIITAINIIRELDKNNQLITYKDLAINGLDISRMGYKGAQIQEKLANVYEYVLNNPDKNDATLLIKYIAKLKQ